MVSIDVHTQNPAFGKFSSQSELLSYRKIPLLDTQEWLKVLEGEDTVVVENQYFHFNVKAFERLVRAKGILIGYALVSGVDRIIEIQASQWQTAMLHVSKKDKRKRRKELSIRIASTRYNLKLSDDDIADAILLGAYYLENH